MKARAFTIMPKKNGLVGTAAEELEECGRNALNYKGSGVIAAGGKGNRDRHGGNKQ
jgi:hypothetical protein